MTEPNNLAARLAIHLQSVYGEALPGRRSNLWHRDAVKLLQEVGVPSAAAGKKTRIEHELVYLDGGTFRRDVPWPGSSTSAGMLLMHADVGTTKPMRLFRVFHDGKLVREWDEVNQRYQLELD